MAANRAPSVTGPVAEFRRAAEDPFGQILSRGNDDGSVFLNPGRHAAPAFADLDGDGDLDLVVAGDFGDNYGTNFGFLQAYENDGSGRFTPFDPDPLAALDQVSRPKPAFADLDGDGDLDLVVGGETLGKYSSYGSSLRSYENLDGAFQPFAVDPLEGIDPGSYPAPAFADLDGDGDLDLVLGQDDGTLRSFENRGAGGFVPAAVNPFAGVDVGFAAAPGFVDLDGDGDPDLVVANANGVLLPLENRGAAGFARFAGDPFAGQVIGPAPAFADVDGDGVLDLAVGLPDGTLRGFELLPGGVRFTEGGTGTVLTATGFDADGDTIAWSLAGEDASLFSIDAASGEVRFLAAPEAGAPRDADGDNRYRLTLIASDGALEGKREITVLVVPNAAPVVTGPVLDLARIEDERFAGILVPFLNDGRAFADLDADGDLDLVQARSVYTGTDWLGSLTSYENRGAGGFVAFAVDPLAGIPVGQFPMPAFADLDGDGDKDLVVASDATGFEASTFRAFENRGAGGFGAFGAGLPGIDGIEGYAPAFADLDGDGDDDLVYAGVDGWLRVQENRGEEGFAASSWNPFGRVGPINRIEDAPGDVPLAANIRFTFADLDADGDPDLVLGGLRREIYGPYDVDGDGFFETSFLADRSILRSFENRGDDGFVAFADDPFGTPGLAGFGAPTIGDLDADGTLNLVLGETFLDGTSFEILPGTVRFEEGRTGRVLTATGNDPEGAPLTWSLAGEDAGLFAIDPLSGEVRFLAPPDFAAPGDADGDNLYRLTLVASDGMKQGLRAVTVAVVDRPDGMTLAGTPAADALAGDGGPDSLSGRAGSDTLVGEAGDDTIAGRQGDDRLEGGDGVDRLAGGGGSDTVTGGAGRDLMQGGAGADRFGFLGFEDSGGDAVDTILDFVRGEDRIDLSAIDTSLSMPGDQGFRFLGERSAVPGETYTPRVAFAFLGGDTIILADSEDLDPAPNLKIRLSGLHALTADDFLL